MKQKVLLIGYGSSGKRHAGNLLDLGITPYVITRHPDALALRFINKIEAIKNEKVTHCIIASATYRHLTDLENCLRLSNGLKNVLIEKPICDTYLKANQIRRICDRQHLNVFVGYNLRFMDALGKVKKFVRSNIKRIKIVEAVCGQDLNEWRTERNIKQAYSAFRRKGGGVDLDLSHEVDYILWLFGNKFIKKFIYRNKISQLKIDSPDIFKMLLDYKNFIVDISLDYIRKPKERYLKIICDSGRNLYCDFASGLTETYKKMLRVFLGLDKNNAQKLCTLNEALDVLKTIEV